MLYRNLAFALVLVGVLSCNANPYSDVSGVLGPYQNKSPGGTFTIQAPPTVDITEGTAGVTPITSTTGGTSATLAVSGLPTWATFDVTTGNLTLTPPVGAGSNPSNPAVNQMNYVITVTLATSASPVVSISQPLVVIVHQQATTMQINDLPSTQAILEGQNYNISFQVTSTQFTGGPFEISGVSLPAGIQIQATADPTTFQLSYSPSYTTATTANQNVACTNFGAGFCTSLDWTLTVVAPNGTAMSMPLTWQVQDVRQPPMVVSPSSVQGAAGTVSFQAQVQDPNGETIPQITATANATPVPTVTTIQSSPGTSTTLPFSAVTISWKPTAVPPVGSSQTINLKSCVFDTQGAYNNCVTTPVTVQF